MKKGIIFTFVSFVFILMLISTGSAESITGACGANATFTLDENGLMTISGS